MAQNRRPEAEAQPDSSSEDEEGSSEESEEQEDNDSTPFSKNSSGTKMPDATPTSAHPQSSSDCESESESEPDSSPNIARRSSPNVKSIVSKPMEEVSKAIKKSRSDTPAAKSSATTVERTVERENGGRESKRGKKKKKSADAEDGGVYNDTGKKNGDDVKKQLFQRLWSEEDEIVILKGMIEFRVKKGADPVADLNAFHDFIKKSLHIVDVSKTQFSAKVRRLKKKYENNLTRGKNGQDRSFSNPHERKTYELSKKVWGGSKANGAEVEHTKVGGKGIKKQKVSPKEDVPSLPDKTREETGRKVESNTGGKQLLWLGKSIGESSLEEIIMKDGLELVSSPQKLELQKKWKQFRVDQVELYLKLLDTIHEQTKLVMEALKSSGH